MNQWWNITKRELRSYFNSPIAYCFIVVFLIVTCGLFMTTFFLSKIATMRPFFSSLPLILIVFVPAITMRLWAEERKSKTLPLLFSLPTGSASLVLGKFAASFIFGSLALLSTLTIPLMLAALGRPDPGPIIGGYFGGILLIGFLMALGMAISAFFQDQIVAFIITLVAGFGCYLIGLEFISAFIDGWIPGFGTFLRDTIGISSHFNSFAKGVLDLSDLLFFLLFTIVFILINILTLEGHLRMRTTRGFVLGCVLLLGIVVFANGVLHEIPENRFDLTENKLYTVSPATKRVLERLKVPIRVTYYVSPRSKLPTPMKDMARDVGDMLEELERLSPKFSYRIVNPEAMPDQIEILNKKGIRPFSAQTIEQDSFNIKRIYSSIAVSYLNKKEEVIPQVVPDSLGSLEYDLVSRIYRLTLKSRPKVVLVTPKSSIDPKLARMLQEAGRPVPPDQDRFTRIVDLLESQGYDVVRQQITKEHPIPKDARLLMIIAPQKLGERQRFEVYRFLRSGRPVFIASQTYTYDYSEGPGGPELHARKTLQGADALLSPFGITIGKDMFFDPRHVTLHVTSQRQIGMFTALVQTPVNYPVQIEVLPDTMDQKVSITSSLPGLLYLWGSPIEIDNKTLKKLGLEYTVLFTSSGGAWTREFHLGPLSRRDLIPSGTNKSSPYPLSVLIEGTFPDPFQGKGVPKWPGKESGNATGESPGEVLSTSLTKPRQSRLLVVGCSEMFSDMAIRAMGNAVFLLNTADALGLGEELIHIRNKTQVQRFIAPIGAREKVLWRGFTVFLMPTFWILYGIIRVMRRRKNRLLCERGGEQ